MWPDVELRELGIFLALADELHFGRTAQRLGISQPGVSEAVRVLESRLGVKGLRPDQPPSPARTDVARRPGPLQTQGDGGDWAERE